MNAELYALVGTALSAFVAAVGYVLKNQYERRRTTRIVLFYLLELHHWVARLQFGIKHYPQEHIERCQAALKRRGVTLDESHLQLLQLLLPALVRNLALAEIRALKLQIAEPFAKALMELAKDDPLLAFELRGKDDIASMEEKLESAAPGPITLGDLTTDLASHLPRMLDSEEDFERTVSLDALDRSIRMTASRCGLRMRFDVSRHLNKSREVDGLARIDPAFAQRTQEFIEKALDLGVPGKTPAEPEKA